MKTNLVSGWFLHRSLSTASNCPLNSFVALWECVVPWTGPGFWNLSHVFCTGGWMLRPFTNTCTNRSLSTKWLPKPAVSLPAFVCQSSKFWGTTVALVLHVSQATQPGQKRVTVTVTKQIALILPPGRWENPWAIHHVPPVSSSCCECGLLLLWGPALLQDLLGRNSDFKVTWALSHRSKVTRLWAGIQCKWHTPANPQVLFLQNYRSTIL